MVLRGHQHCGEALAAGAPSASDAMDVILGMDRDVVIEDVAHIGDIESSSRDIACGKEGDRAVAEGVERRGALMLIHVTMETAGAESMLDQGPMQQPDIALAIAEDDGVLDAGFPHQ